MSTLGAAKGASSVQQSGSSYKEAIELQAGHSRAEHIFGLTPRRLAKAQRYAHSALAAYHAVVQKSPNLPEAWLGRG